VQRLVLLRFILSADHPTKDEIVKYVKKTLGKVNTATIYNTINALEKSNLIKKIKFPHLNKMVYDHNTSNHYHFLDEDTGQLIDLDSTSVEVTSKDLQIDSVEILFRGKRK
jgi:Fur family iron response transcriptional regulator